MPARGRHRRYKPGAVSRTSLRVTAGGAGLALPLVAAGAGHAASEETWDRVAECESSGRWHIDTGNGYFGGLQFSRSTWEAFGGTQYAPTADGATRDQQIAVAEKVLESQGQQAWPTCGPRTGLGADDDAPAPRTDPGAEARTAPAGEADRAKEERAAAARAERRAKETTYEVVGGDSLSSIARAHEVDGGWPALYERNRGVVGGDPDLILPGQRLSLEGRTPAAPAPGAGERRDGPESEKREKRAGKPEPRAEKPEPEPRAEKPEPEPRAEKTEPKPEARAEETSEDKRKKQEKASSPRATSPRATSPVAGAHTGTPYRTAGSGWSSGYHTGVDFPVPTGTTVRAVSGGDVVSAGWAGAYGYQVVLRHDDGRYSQYAHLSAISISSGQQVTAGQRLGRSGSTGNSTGPHLHFEVRTGPGYGSDIDPLAYLRGRGVSI